MAPPQPHARFKSAHKDFKNSSLAGRPKTTVTVFPPRPFFSMRSFATTRSGTAALPAVSVLLHWQFDSGQPHFTQVRPPCVEYTSLEDDTKVQ